MSIGNSEYERMALAAIATSGPTKLRQTGLGSRFEKPNSGECIQSTTGYLVDLHALFARQQAVATNRATVP